MKSNPSRKRTLIALGSVLLYCASQTATAIPTSAGVIGKVSFNVLQPTPIDVSTFGLHQLSGPGGDLSFESGLGPSPFLSTAANGISPNTFGRSSGLLRYDVEVLGDPGDVKVWMNVRGSASATTVNDPLAAFALRSLWWLDTAEGAGILSGGIQTPQLSGSFSDSFNETHLLSLVANQTYRVTLLSDVGIRGGTASSFVDPVFLFAPGSESGYSFRFSEGVGNLREVEAPPVGVTEPGGLALMSAVLLPLGLFRRRKR